MGAQASLNLKDTGTRGSALHIAGMESREAVVSLLVEASAEVNATNDERRTPLHVAGSANVVHTLLAANDELDARDREGWLPLHLTAFTKIQCYSMTEPESRQAADVAQALIEASASVDGASEPGGFVGNCTPLLWAAYEDLPAVSQVLCRARANLDARDAENSTPLHLAVERGWAATVRVLADHGAPLEEWNECLQVAGVLGVAAQLGHLAVVQALVESRANLEEVAAGEAGGRFSRAVHVAIAAGHATVVQRLLQAGSPLDDGTDPLDGCMTGLNVAAEAGHEMIVQMLLEEQADLEGSHPKDGKRPLRYGVEAGHESIVRLLLDLRADFLEKYEGRTALDFARAANHTEIISLLEPKWKVD